MINYKKMIQKKCSQRKTMIKMNNNFNLISGRKQLNKEIDN